MSKMRWVRNSGDPENEVPIGLLVMIGLFIALLIGCGFGIGGCIRYASNEKMTGAVITQDNHMEIVKVSPKQDVMTIIRLEADPEIDLGLKTCEDYELILTEKVKITKRYGRSSYQVDGLDSYIKVKRSFVLQIKYKTSYVNTVNKGTDKLLYVKIELESKYK